MADECVKTTTLNRFLFQTLSTLITFGTKCVKCVKISISLKLWLFFTTKFLDTERGEIFVFFRSFDIKCVKTVNNFGAECVKVETVGHSLEQIYLQIKCVLPSLPVFFSASQFVFLWKWPRNYTI